MTDESAGTPKTDLTVVPWYICAAEDGLKMDCIMVAVMNGDEVCSVSLHLAGKTEAE